MKAVTLVLLFFFLTGLTNLVGQNLPKELITVNENTWKSATVFTHVVWNDLLFYGGGSGSDGGDPRHEIEIGVFHLTKADSGYEHPDNPIITRKQFGLDQPGRGITPLAIYERKDSLFLFCTARNGENLNPNIVLISAPVNNPYKWGGLKTIVDKDFSGKENNHGASVIVDPNHPKNLLLYFAALSPSEDYRVLLATVPIAEIACPESYRLLNDYSSAVLKRSTERQTIPLFATPNRKKNMNYGIQAIARIIARRDRLLKLHPKEKTILNRRKIP